MVGKMFFFLKPKVTLLDTKDKAELERKENLLKAAGIKTNSWSTEQPPVIGGPHMKPQDWQSVTDHNKDNERIVYHLEVAKDDQYKAMKILLEDGGVDLTSGGTTV